ncbi:MAG: helix-turn-helix domain-containing protein [Tumebacillaceae bacterium]
MQVWKQQKASQIGRNIRDRRKTLGLAQADLAKGLLSVQSISLIERGKLNITSQMLSILAERLQCQVDDLLQTQEDLQEGWLEDLLQSALRAKESNHVSEAIEIFHALYTESFAKNITKYLQESTYHLCLLYQATAKYSVSTDWGHEAMRRHDPHLHLDRVLQLYITLGHNSYEQGKMWESFDLLREAEKLVDAQQNHSEQAGRLYSSMAIIKQMLQNWEGCIWYCERALQIFEMNDMVIYVGRTLMMMGTAYKNQGQYDRAHQHIERAIRILSQTSDGITHARAIHNLGELEWKMDQFEKARKSFLRSFKLKRQTNDHGTIQNTLRALARLSIKQGRLDEARHFLNDCLSRAELLDNPLQLAITWRHLGDLALEEQNEEEFIHQYKKAIDAFEKLDFSIEIAETAEKLGEFYLQKGRERLAIPYLQAANRHYRKLLRKS